MPVPAIPYCEYLPSPSLRSLVECYWTFSSDSGAPSRVLPDGCADLLFDRRPASGPVGRVIGTMRQARLLEDRGARDIVAVRFRPGGARALLGVPVTELVDGAADLSAIVAPGPELPGLVDGVHAPNTRALDALDAFLLGRLTAVSPGDLDAARIATTVLDAPEPSVAALADRLGLSRQHLRRRVLGATGLAPKRLARIGRLRRVAQRIREGTTPDAQLALEAGYYDQAHFANEFRALALLTPGDYQRELGAG